MQSISGGLRKIYHGIASVGKMSNESEKRSGEKKALEAHDLL
jgi:hypothetical protein